MLRRTHARLAAAGGVVLALAAPGAASAGPVALVPPPPVVDLLTDADAQYDGARAGDQVGSSVAIGAVTSPGSADTVVSFARGTSGFTRVLRGTPLGILDLRTATSGLVFDDPFQELYEPSVANVGDVDGDGRDDVSRQDSRIAPALIYLGRPAQGGRLSASSPGVIAVTSPGRSLERLVGAGDVDGDGLADLAAMTGTNGNRRIDVVRSAAGRTSIEIGAPGISGYRITTAGGFGELLEVARAGDMNGDGRDDLAVQVDGGKIVVVFGSTTTLPIDIGALGGAGFAIRAEDATGSGDFRDVVLAAAGDVNADGLDDLAIGTRLGEPSQVYVVYGRRNATTPIDLAELGTEGLRIRTSDDAVSSFGESLAAGANLVGSRAPDIAIGAPAAAEGGRADQGAVWVVSVSGQHGTIDLDQGGWTGMRIDGPTAGARIGEAYTNAWETLAMAPDRLVIGAPSLDPLGRRDAGSVFVVDGTVEPLVPPLAGAEYLPYVPPIAARSGRAARKASAAAVRLRARRAARLVVSLVRVMPGHRLRPDGKCLPGASTSGRPCARPVPVRSVTRKIAKGKQVRIALTAAARRLPAGRYALRVRAVDATGRSFGPWRLRFRIR